MSETAPASASAEQDLDDLPVGTLANQKKYFRFDIVSGTLVFLIALPLCLAISIASGYPALAGVLTAIVGGIVGATISNSELTIKGPAAGLIVIVLGCVTDFGYTGGKDPAADLAAYQLALGVGVAAAAFQVGFGLLRMGSLGDFFPTSAVHGMLAAIGVIIMSKQIPVAVGLKSAGSPFALIAAIPQTLLHMNPAIAMIGGLSLCILFGLPLIKNRLVRKIPGQLVVLIAAIPISLYLGLGATHSYQFGGGEYEVGPQHLVNVPMNMLSAVAFPDFSGLVKPVAWKWIVMFALVGSLESLISSKAVDLLDPWKRKTNLNRDLVAAGIGNLVASGIGGLPMISEIVRSRANIDNGARTRFSNLYHGLLLLFFVAVFPMLLNSIPLAALAAMLIFTGFRLAHPKEFVHMFKVGPEQLVIYCVTIVGVLATDLLIGVALGIVTEWVFHLINGASLGSMFQARSAVVADDERGIRVKIEGSAVFSNWIPLRRKIMESGLAEGKSVTVDLSNASLVDHTVLEKLHEISRDFKQQELELKVVGIDDMRPLSDHPFAARKRTGQVAA